MNGTPRSTALLNKVFDYLDSIDVSALSWSERKDFLEVVQKCQFQESYGQIPSGFSGLCAAPFNGTGKSVETNAGPVDATPDAK